MASNPTQQEGADDQQVVTVHPTTTTGDLSLDDRDPAVWTVDPADTPSADSDAFGVLVTRIGCNSGKTGDIWAPVFDETDDEVVITFSVFAFNLMGDSLRDWLDPKMKG